MQTYLKYINPVISALVLIICIYAATTEDNKPEFKISNLYAGGLPTYFLAKGLFCSSTLFIIGKILEHILKANKKE